MIFVIRHCDVMALLRQNHNENSFTFLHGFQLRKTLLNAEHY